MTTTIRYPNKTKQSIQTAQTAQTAIRQPGLMNRFLIYVKTQYSSFPILTEQAISISELDVLMGNKVIVEFEIDAVGRILKTIREIAMSGEELTITITSMDGHNPPNENFSITLTDAAIAGSTISALKDRDIHKNSNLAFTSFDNETSNTLKAVVMFTYQDTDFDFPNIK